MSQKTVAQLEAEIDAQITTNGANAITAAVMRPVLKDMVESAGNLADGTSAPTVDVQVFTSSGTWTKPSSGKFTQWIVMGGGGGGGGGYKTNGIDDNNQGSPGSGGGGGGFTIGWAPSSALPGSVNVVVGAGGAGAPQTTVSGAEAGGTAGDNSSFGTFCSVQGGAGGGAGNNVPSGSQNREPDGLGMFTNLASPSSDFVSNTAGNGGSGGGITNEDAPTSGESGGVSISVSVDGIGAGSGGALPAGNGGDGTTQGVDIPLGGGGGGGGAANGTEAATNAGHGGNGALYGAGGGGGGVCIGSLGNGGGGGDGSQGIIVVTTWF